MNTQKSDARQKKLAFLMTKKDQMTSLCYQICTKKGTEGTSLTSKQLSCLQACQIKLLNSYNYMYDLILKGGISRQPESLLKQKKIK